MKDVSKALTIALASRILVIVVMVISSFLFSYATTENMNVQEMNTPIVGMFVRWDSVHYLTIAQSGFPLGYPKTHPAITGTLSPMPSKVASGLWAFYPFYPAVMRVLATIFMPFISTTASLMLAGVIISNIAFIVSAYFFYKLTRKLFNHRIALLSTAFYSLWVGAVFFSAIYPEALFMALALGAFYFLEENKLVYASILGFLAAFTRSDGFLIAIPFFIYALQKIRIHRWYLRFEDKIQFVNLLVCSAIVASPFLIYNIAGYYLAGGVFPIQVIARNSNWGIYPPLTSQFVAPYCTIKTVQAFILTGLVLMLLPIGYFLVEIKKVFTVEAKTVGFWVFYAATIYIVFTQAIIYSILRYAVTLIPLYWVLAKIYTKSRTVGIILFAVSTVLFIIGAYLLEINSPYFM